MEKESPSFLITSNRGSSKLMQTNKKNDIKLLNGQWQNWTRAVVVVIISQSAATTKQAVGDHSGRGANLAKAPTINPSLTQDSLLRRSVQMKLCFCKGFYCETILSNRLYKILTGFSLVLRLLCFNCSSIEPWCCTAVRCSLPVHVHSTEKQNFMEIKKRFL